MDRTYNRIAGQSLERLAALSDGVFAIAMTLIVLEIRIAAPGEVHSEHDLWLALAALGPRLLMYLVTFMTLGIFWVGQQTQLNLFARADRNLAWIHIAFLATVSITPFSTMLMGQFITYRVALGVYWLNILLLGATLLAGWVYGCAAKLATAEVTATVDRAIVRRIVLAQGLYAAGAALCVFSTYLALAAILAVQTSYAVGLHWWPFPSRRPTPDA
jgi:uncharacterized membrane protein